MGTKSGLSWPLTHRFETDGSCGARGTTTPFFVWTVHSLDRAKSVPGQRLQHWQYGSGQTLARRSTALKRLASTSALQPEQNRDSEHGPLRGVRRLRLEPGAARATLPGTHLLGGRSLRPSRFGTPGVLVIDVRAPGIIGTGLGANVSSGNSCHSEVAVALGGYCARVCPGVHGASKATFSRDWLRSGHFAGQTELEPTARLGWVSTRSRTGDQRRHGYQGIAERGHALDRGPAW
jgi:hypothetical protein